MVVSGGIGMSGFLPNTRFSPDAAADQMFEQDFAGHCLPFDAAAASEYALLVAARTKIGHAISTEDAQIAAITIRHQMPLVTRNTKDFAHIGELQLINPWVTD